MKREEEKREAARKYAIHDVDTDETDFYGNYVKKEDFVLPEYNAFLEGCKWSDENPKSSWISVKDDLPCNHEELTPKDYTLEVLTLNDCNSYRVLRMWGFDGKWIWGLDDFSITYWMRLPEPPKRIGD